MVAALLADSPHGSLVCAISLANLEIYHAFAFVRDGLEGFVTQIEVDCVAAAPA